MKLLSRWILTHISHPDAHVVLMSTREDGNVDAQVATVRVKHLSYNNLANLNLKLLPGSAIVASRELQMLCTSFSLEKRRTLHRPSLSTSRLVFTCIGIQVIYMTVLTCI